MSSTHVVLCLSHDPATVISEHETRREAFEAVNDGSVDLHPHCDIVISRVSGAPIEFGCPGIDISPCGGHRDVKWVDADWLRLLAQASPEQIKELRGLRCWSSDRLTRLRYQLES